MNDKKEKTRIVENFLRKYHTYKVNIINCERQLSYLFPNVTASFESDPSNGNAFKVSTTEKFAIDRIESKRALDLHEQIAMSKMIVESIDSALAVLTAQEQTFVDLRYFQGMSFYEIADAMKASERSIFDLRIRLANKLAISLSNLLAL